MSDKPKTHQNWWGGSAYSEGIGHVKEHYIPTLNAWTAAVEATRQEMQAELNFYKSSEYLTSILFSKSVAFGNKSPIDYVIENGDIEYLMGTLGRMLGGDATYHSKLTEMQAEIDKRDALLIKCIAIFNDIDNNNCGCLKGSTCRNITSVELGIEELTQEKDERNE